MTSSQLDKLHETLDMSTDESFSASAMHGVVDCELPQGDQSTESTARGGKEATSPELISVEFIAPMTALVVINLIVLVGNALVIMAVFTHAKLRRTITNRFIVSLAVADMMVGAVVLPFSSANEVLRYWPFGSAWCSVWLAFDVWLCTASIFNLCAISFDRYLAISRPFQYRRLMSPLRAKLLIVCVWILSFVICCPPLIGWNDSGSGGEASLTQCGVTKAGENFVSPDSRQESMAGLLFVEDNAFERGSKMDQSIVDGNSGDTNEKGQLVERTGNLVIFRGRPTGAGAGGGRNIEDIGNRFIEGVIQKGTGRAQRHDSNFQIDRRRSAQSLSREWLMKDFPTSDDESILFAQDTSFESDVSNTSNTYYDDDFVTRRPDCVTTHCRSLAILPQCALTSDPGYVIYSACGSFWVPMFVMVVFYWKIYKTAAEATAAFRRGFIDEKHSTGNGGVRGGRSGAGGGGRMSNSNSENSLTGLRVHRGGGAASRGSLTRASDGCIGTSVARFAMSTTAAASCGHRRSFDSRAPSAVRTNDVNYQSATNIRDVIADYKQTVVVPEGGNDTPTSRFSRFALFASSSVAPGTSASATHNLHNLPTIIVTSTTSCEATDDVVGQTGVVRRFNNKDRTNSVDTSATCAADINSYAPDDKRNDKRNGNGYSLSLVGCVKSTGSRSRDRMTSSDIDDSASEACLSRRSSCASDTGSVLVGGEAGLAARRYSSRSASITSIGGQSKSGGGLGFKLPSKLQNILPQLRSLNREKKAAKTVGVIVGCFIVCWAPFFTVYLLGAICNICRPPPLVFDFFFWLGYCNSAANPFIYGLCSRDFRYAFAKLLRCRCERRRGETNTSSWGGTPSRGGSGGGTTEFRGDGVNGTGRLGVMMQSLRLQIVTRRDIEAYTH